MVFIGQQPGSYEDEGTVLPVRPGSTGQRLAQMMGITPEAFAENFIRMNVSAHYEPDGFEAAYHRIEMDNILPLLEGRRVVLLGPQVAEAFAIPRDQYSWAEWFDHPTAHILMAVIPHPSGLNRLYNNPEIHNMISTFLDGCWAMR
jgi:uracil-DNA glycosylase